MKPMLAGKFDENKQRFPCIAQPKLDGIRCLIMQEQAVSRTLKPIPNQHVQTLFGNNRMYGFDGELIVGDPTAPDVFQKTTSGVMSRDGTPDVVFYVFDLWDDDVNDYNSRREIVEEYIQGLSIDNRSSIKLVPQCICNSLEDVSAYEEEMLAMGWEGIILRDPNSLYKYGRATTNQGQLLKVKRFVDSEAMITGFEEQMHNANVATSDNLGYTQRSTHKANKFGKDTLGKLQVIGVEGKWQDVDFKVGSGFDDALRQEIWDNQDKYLNRIVKYKYQDVGSKDKPRIPIFLGFRED